MHSVACHSFIANRLSIPILAVRDHAQEPPRLTWNEIICEAVIQAALELKEILNLSEELLVAR